MKDLMSDVTDLSRASLPEIKNILDLSRLLSLINFMNEEDEEGNSYVEIPTMGKILVSKDFDFEFIPNQSFKKEIFGIRQNPRNFLRNELKKVLKIGEVNE